MKALLMKTEVSMVAIIGLIFILAAVGTENFLTAYNLTNILHAGYLRAHQGEMLLWPHPCEDVQAHGPQ